MSGSLMWTPIYEGALFQGDDLSSSKIFVVVYPSNESATKFLPATTEKPDGYGLGICVVPKQKRNSIKFWSKKGEDPTIFSVENRAEDGLTVRSGRRIGSVGLVARFLVGNDNREVQLAAYENCMAQLLDRGRTSADTDWIKDCLEVFQEKALIQNFDIDEFTHVMWRVVTERTQDTDAQPFHVKDFDYLAWLASQSK